MQLKSKDKWNQMKKIQLYIQKDCMQCGIACLQMVCAYYGREYNFDFLSTICHATTEGVSLLGIKEAATKLGLDTISKRATIEELSQSILPCILHWNQNHFVVLYDVKKERNFILQTQVKVLPHTLLMSSKNIG